MKATILSIPVRDQQQALAFYTEKLGFIKKKDIPLGGGNRWLTLVSPEAPEGPELLLEPSPLHFEPAKVFQEALSQAGMPWTQFEVQDVDREYERLTAHRRSLVETLAMEGLSDIEFEAPQFDIVAEKLEFP